MFAFIILHGASQYKFYRGYPYYLFHTGRWTKRYDTLPAFCFEVTQRNSLVNIADGNDLFSFFLQ